MYNINLYRYACIQNYLENQIILLILKKLREIEDIIYLTYIII